MVRAAGGAAAEIPSTLSVQGILRDVSDRKRAEAERAEQQHAENALRQLREAQQQLVMREKMASLGMLAAGVAVWRVWKAQGGCMPQAMAGHSLGEYGALVAAGVLPFGQALQIVSARGREMAKVQVEDTGCMAAIFAPLDEINAVLPTLNEAPSRS